MPIPLIIIFALAFLLRLALISLPPFAIDMGSFIAWAEHMVVVGPTTFYATVWSDYAPGYLYALWGLGGVHRFIPAIPYEILLKLPSAIADVVTGFLMYTIVRSSKFIVHSKKEQLGLLAAGLYLFNPVPLFNSTVWGQVDAVSTLLVVMAGFTFYRALFHCPVSALRQAQGKPHTSPACRRGREKLLSVLAFGLLGLATVVKPQSLIFVPMFFLYSASMMWSKKARSWPNGQMVIWLIAFVAPIFVLSLPFFLSDPLFGLIKHLGGSAATYPYTSVFAMNFWGIFGTWQSDIAMFWNISYRNWGLILFSIMYLVVSIKYILNKNGTNDKGGELFLLLSFVAVSFFMLPTRIHERYLHPFFALFLMSGMGWFAHKTRWQYVSIYVAISLLHFLNLYHVYAYYNPNFLKIAWLSDGIGTYFGILSAISFAWYSVFVLRTMTSQKL